MSTVINPAYRIPYNKLFEFKKAFYSIGLDHVIKTTKKLYYGVSKKEIMVYGKVDYGDKFKYPVSSDRRNHWYRFNTLLETRLVPAAEGMMHSEYDVTCGLSISIDSSSTWAYIRPIYGGAIHISNLKILHIGDYVEDYSYWNNTDLPDHITREEWEKRGEEWINVLSFPSPLKFYVMNLAKPNTLYYSHTLRGEMESLVL